MDQFRKHSCVAICFVLQLACSHPLEVNGDGQILSESGTRRCSAETSPCENLVANDYLETYMAFPQGSSQFAGWGNYCQVFSKQCSFNLPSNIVQQHWGKAYPPLIANFEPVGSNGLWDLERLTTNGPIRWQYARVWSGRNILATNGRLSSASYMSADGGTDVNGDGVDDAIIGAPRANAAIGEVYIIFGSASSNLGGSLPEIENGAGFSIINSDVDQYDLGFSVSIQADINGDGVNDMLIGAPNFTLPGSSCGGAYVVFGGSEVGSGGQIDLASMSASQGFRIEFLPCVTQSDIPLLLGMGIDSAGDFNNDGIDDLLISMPKAYGQLNEEFHYLPFAAGRVYVLFGNEDIGSSGVINLQEMDVSEGVALWGSEQNHRAGSNIDGACDINADGIDDIILSVPGAARSYVVFGTEAPFEDTILMLDDLAAAQGFYIEGGDTFLNYFDGRKSTAFVGDVNGDRICDLSEGDYIVFGHPGIGSSGSIDLTNLDSAEAIMIAGGEGATSGGDFNNDGINDLLIGSPEAAVRGGIPQGAAFVVFGQSSWNGGEIQLNSIDQNQGRIFMGDKPNDETGAAITSAGDMNGDGVDDILVISRGAVEGQGYVHLIFGGRNAP